MTDHIRQLVEAEKKVREFDAWFQKMRVEQLERDKDLPRCDCGQSEGACYYSCVGI